MQIIHLNTKELQYIVKTSSQCGSAFNHYRLDSVSISSGPHNWNRNHNRAEIGYHISEEYKRKGFMYEALSRIIDFGFNELKLHRIETLVSAYNTPLLKIIQNYGFTQEGMLRQHHLVDAKFDDSLVFSSRIKEHQDRLNA